MKIIAVVGARPNFMKVAPILREAPLTIPALEEALRAWRKDFLARN